MSILIGTNYTPFLVDFFLIRMKQKFHKETNEGNPDRLIYIPLYRYWLRLSYLETFHIDETEGMYLDEILMEEIC
jgi:hypothetical protein